MRASGANVGAGMVRQAGLHLRRAEHRLAGLYAQEPSVDPHGPPEPVDLVDRESEGLPLAEAEAGGGDSSGLVAGGHRLDQSQVLDDQRHDLATIGPGKDDLPAPSAHQEPRLPGSFRRRSSEEGAGHRVGDELPVVRERPAAVGDEEVIQLG